MLSRLRQTPVWSRLYVGSVIVLAAFGFVSGAVANYHYAKLHPDADPYGPKMHTVDLVPPPELCPILHPASSTEAVAVDDFDAPANIVHAVPSQQYASLIFNLQLEVKKLAAISIERSTPLVFGFDNIPLSPQSALKNNDNDTRLKAIAKREQNIKSYPYNEAINFKETVEPRVASGVISKLLLGLGSAAAVASFANSSGEAVVIRSSSGETTNVSPLRRRPMKTIMTKTK